MRRINITLEIFGKEMSFQIAAHFSERDLINHPDEIEKIVMNCMEKATQSFVRRLKDNDDILRFLV